MELRGNTVGSKVYLKTAKDYYFLGLWLADGYWWSSSFGLSSTNPELIRRFSSFLQKIAPDLSLKRKVYQPNKRYKQVKRAEHVYINSRAITREFLLYKKKKKLLIPKNFIPAYLAGRIDGDGCIDLKYRSGIRISYGKKYDAKRDKLIFGKENVSLYRYQAAGTWVIYLKKHFRKQIIPKTKKYSLKLCPVETSLI